MRIARFAGDDDPRFGVIGDDNGVPTIAVLNGDPLYAGLNLSGQKIPLAEVRLLAPVIPRSKVVCVGKNYAKHAAEMGGEVPEEPLIFLKPNTSVIGPGEPIFYPEQSKDVHFEGELAVVIGRICRDVPAEDAAKVIFGYTVANDVTARDLQAKDGQWARAKGFDTFCPLGPVDRDRLRSVRTSASRPASALRRLRARSSRTVARPTWSSRSRTSSHTSHLS